MDGLSNQYVLFAVATLGVITLYFAFTLMFRRSNVQLRTQRLATLAAEAGWRDGEQRQSAAKIEDFMAALGIDIEKARREYYVPLGRAGLTSPESFAKFLLFQKIVQPIIALLGIFILFSWVTGPLGGTSGLLKALVGGLLAIIGLYGGKLYLSNLRAKREHRLTRSFPDAIDLLLICVESGLSLDSALERVTRELRVAHPDITDELDRTRMELTLLNNREQALLNLAARTDIMGFKSLVSSLLQSEKFGTNLSDTLRVLSDDYRTTRLLNAENKAARIPALITLPLIFFILPAFMLIILGPPFIKVSQQGGLFGGAEHRTRK